MGYKSILDKQVKGLMKTLGQNDGLAPFHSYISVNNSTSVYDTNTGRYTENVTRYNNVPMVLTKYSSEEIDGNKIVVTDQKAIIAALDLPTIPTINDKIVDPSGQTFMVMDVGGVPGTSVWVLQIRETDE